MEPEKFDTTIAVAYDYDAQKFVADEANGKRNEDYVFDVDKSIFYVDGEFPADEIWPGNVVPMLDADGNRLQATIVSVKKDKVTIDLNHPLADKDLHFKGVVIENRPATDDEVKGVTQVCCGGCKGGDQSCGGCKGGDANCEADGCCEGCKQD